MHSLVIILLCVMERRPIRAGVGAEAVAITGNYTVWVSKNELGASYETGRAFGAGHKTAQETYTRQLGGTK